MAEMSLSQAAALAGKSKSTLTRAIKSGRMSALRRADGTFGLDPAEVLRVFPADAVRSGAPTSEIVAHDAVVHAAQQVEINALRDDLATARQQAAVAQALADERARALEAAERNLTDLRRLLSGPPGPTSVRPWWRFWS